MTLITKKNEVFLRVDADPHIHQELSDYFTFEVPNAKFLQKQRRYKYWDGKIRLYSPGNGELYVGLYDYLVEWLDKKGYNYICGALSMTKNNYHKKSLLIMMESISELFNYFGIENKIINL